MSNASFAIPSFNLSGLQKLRKRLVFSVLALVIYRLGSYVTIPGLDLERLAFILNQSGGTFMGRLMTQANMLSGGSLLKCTIFSLGLTPYITVSIIIHTLSFLVPHLERLKKEGESGRRKINQYTRYGTIVAAIVMSIGQALPLIYYGVIIDPINFYVIGILTWVAGAAFLMWLGDQITAHGIGNGSSLIIFAGILSGLPSSAVRLIEQVRQNQISPFVFAFIIITIILLTSFVIFVERAQRKITINYPQRQQGRHMYAAQSSHLPLKINMAGIMPAIFSYNIIGLPSMLLEWSGVNQTYPFFQKISILCSPGKPGYMVMLAIAITFFCFFYTALDYNPREMADNLRKSGAFIPGVRPGIQSEQYIDKLMTRLTVVGTIYLLSLVLLPDIVMMSLKIPFAFGGSALLIIVGVVIEIIGQVQSLLMSQQYEALLKKAGLKNNLPIR